MGEKAPKAGGDAGPPPQQPVVLGMVLHCAGCAKKVKKSIQHMPGVESIVADPAANRVVVTGTADAAALKARIESKTKKPVQILSAGGAAPSKPGPSESKGGGEEKKKKAAASEPKPDADGAADKSKKGDTASQPPKEEKWKTQPPEEKKHKEETALLKIRLHCESCADRIRRRIYKIKGVKDVVLDNAKDEVKVTGTMDVADMVVYLKEKLNRDVEAVAPGKKDGGGDSSKDKGGDGDMKKDTAAAATKDKGKGIEVAGPSTAAAAASIASPPVGATTRYVSPYGHVAYPQPQGPPPSYYQYYGGNADGMGHAADPYAASHYQQQQQPPPLAQPYPAYYGGNANADPYYQQHAEPQPQQYPPYQYGFEMAPPSQMFSDENPNSCSVM